MHVHQDLADATVRVVCGPSSGSGFHFIRPDIILTNQHVIEPLLTSQAACEAITEGDARMPMDLLAHSHKQDYDFALFRLRNPVPPGRIVLQPKEAFVIERGTEILFSGFPHGIPDLLVHRAMVSGAINDTAFYIDGSVNGGNSGGPILDPSDQTVVGIVTQRRFLGAPELGSIGTEAARLREHCNQLAAQGGRIVMMGIDYGGLARLLSESFLLVHQVIQLNANSGIGIGFHIRHATEECRKLGITT